MIVPAEIESYAAEHSSPEPPLLAAVAEETRAVTDAAVKRAERANSPGARAPARRPAMGSGGAATSGDSVMLVGQVEGRLLEFLVWLSGARTLLEIGTFTGCSALAMAAALPPDGRLTTCEIDPDRAAIARRNFDASPWGDRIDLRVGPALDTVSGLDGPFDLVFIDADKERYSDYFEAVLPKLSEHGFIAVDNVLWDGAVVDPEADDDATRAIRAFNRTVRDDPRVVCVMLTVRDGVTLIRRA